MKVCLAVRIIGICMCGVLLSSCPPPTPPVADVQEVRVQRGTSGPDRLNGTNLRDRLEGFEGNDSLSGGGGDDDLIGGEGNDSLNGGAGNDTALYPQPTIFTIMAPNEGAGAGSYRIRSTLFGEDTLLNIETIQFSNFNDTIILAVGIEGNISINGAEGRDTIILSETARTINARNFRNIELYRGSAMVDQITGGNQGEEFYGGRGDDTIDGGGGLDSALYNESELPAGNVEITASSGNGITVTASENGTDTLRNIEQIILSNDNNHVTIEGEIGFIIIDGGEGIDSIQLPSDDQTFHTTGRYIGFETVQGGSGNDTIFLGEGDQTINGGVGEDTVVYNFLGSVAYRMFSQPNGSLRVVTENGEDSLISVERMLLSSGNDEVINYSGGIHIDGGEGRDSIRLANGGVTISFGTNGNINNIEIVEGGAGDDRFENVLGNIPINGGEGNDTIILGSPTEGRGTVLMAAMYNNIETIRGTSQADTIEGRSTNESIYGGAGNDTINGGGGSDTIHGEDGDDRIDGGEGNNTMRGGTGNDTIISGAGNETIDGGGGNDTLRYSSTSGSSNVYTIRSASENFMVVGGDTHGTDTIQGIETLEFSNGNDTVHLPNSRFAVITGSGNDTIHLPEDPNGIVIHDYEPSQDIINFTNLFQGASPRDPNNIIIREGEVLYSTTGSLSDLSNAELLLSLGNNAILNDIDTIHEREERIILVNATSDPLDPTEMREHEGTRVDISGNTAIVGVWEDNREQGSAYIFVQDINGNWTEQAMLIASNGSAGDRFGYSVGIDGDRVIVGAYLSNEGTSLNEGSAYIFIRNASGNWIEQRILKGSASSSNDYFGYAVDISGETAIVGSLGDEDSSMDAGYAYFFTNNGGSWSESARISSNDSDADDQFGSAVAIDGEYAIIAAWTDDPVVSGTGVSNGGSAYIFVQNGSGMWEQQEKLVADNVQPNIRFGESVDISGNTAIVGAPRGNSGAGSAYIFTRSGSMWMEERLIISDVEGGDSYGQSVAISANRAIVGASEDSDEGSNSGSVYLFTNNGEWSSSDKITASDSRANDRFGSSVAISGNILIIGNETSGVQDNYSYIYHLPRE